MKKAAEVAQEVGKTALQVAEKVSEALAAAAQSVGDNIDDVLNGKNADSAYERSLLGAKDLIEQDERFSKEEAEDAVREIHKLAQTEEGRKEIEEMAAGGGRCSSSGYNRWSPLEALFPSAYAAEPVSTATGAICLAGAVVIAAVYYQTVATDEQKVQLRAAAQGFWDWLTTQNTVANSDKPSDDAEDKDRTVGIGHNGGPALDEGDSQPPGNPKRLPPLLPPISTSSDERRNTPGVASFGELSTIGEGQVWLRGSDGNAGRIPRQVADQLAGKQFNSFDDFRVEFWKTVAKDPVLSKQFGKDSMREMTAGRAPYAVRTQQSGGRIKYELDHTQTISSGGNVYDMNNIIIRTPAGHIARHR